MPYLAICAVVKWEWPWLKEWIDYHRLVGADYFYLYSNETALEAELTLDIVKPYSQMGVAELMRCEGESVQYGVYGDALGRARKGGFRWLGAIDLDEFIYPMQHDSITAVLKNYEGIDALGMNWRCFGSSGHKIRPKSQINDFLHCSTEDFSRNMHVKTIVNPAKATKFPWVHLSDAPTLDEDLKPINGPLHDGHPKIIRVNHYVVRSAQDFWEVKARRGRADGGPLDRDQKFWDVHDRNEVFDDGISRRFGNRLRK